MSKVQDIWKNPAKKSKKKSKTNYSVSCWTKHPVYKIGKHEIVGGSCTSNYPDVDVFIALDGSGKKGKRSYPWNDGVDIYFKIRDMGVPEDLKEFKKLISWTANEMKKGKSVYVGCIGGHGRTGLFLAALTKFMIGDKDAITTVRENYCHKAVESTEQINWLNKHFGITKVKESKPNLSSLWSKGSKSSKNTLADIPWGTDLTANWISGTVTDNKPQNYLCAKGTSLIVNND
jgi:protein-tyrosine phosphatase